MGRNVDGNGQGFTPGRLRLGVVLGVAVVLLYLGVLGRVGFRDPDEGRYASLGAAMVATGDWFLPRLVGLPYLEKPPLLYWMIGAAVEALGTTEFAARLPSALAALAGLGGLFLLGWRGFRWRTGLLAVLILATSPGYAFMSQFVNMDMLVTACITLALVCFYLGCLSPRWWLHPAAYLFMALGTMTKGLIGFLLPGLVMGVFLLLNRRRRGLFRLHQKGALALIPLLVVPWFVHVQMDYPSFGRFFLLDQHLSRFISSGAEHPESIFFFVPVLFLGLFPWSCLMPLSLWWGSRHRHDSLDVFLWTWAGVVFLFFSLSRGKLAPYILPALPPLALLLARQWPDRSGQATGRCTAGTREAGRQSRVEDRVGEAEVLVGLRRACLATSCIMLVAALLVPLALPGLLGKAGRVPPISLAPQAWALEVILGSGGVVLLVLLRHRRPLFWFITLAATSLALFFAVFSIRRAVEPYIGPRALAMAVREEMQPADRILLYRLAQPSVEFYTGRIPFLYGYTGELAYGLQLEPGSGRIISGPEALDRFLRGTPGGRVYCMTRKSQAGEFLRRLRQPVRVVAWNAKRVVFATLPQQAAAGLADRIILAGPG